ncbi:MAG: hypothetical protein AAF998_16355 [Bacteroidota bacterium]
MSQNASVAAMAPWKAVLPGLLMLGLYGLAAFFPEALWGLHYPIFLPPVVRTVFFAVAGLLVASPFFLNWSDLVARVPERDGYRYLRWGIALGMGALCLAFPIASDYYGDAQEMIRNLDGRVEAYDPRMVREALLPIFDFKTGTISFYAAISLLAYWLDANVLQTLFVLEAVAAVVFVWLWLRLCREVIHRPGGRFPLEMIGLTTPALQVYFGHAESYVFPMTLNLAFVVVLVLFVRRRSPGYFWALLPLLYLAVKFSITGVLLLVPFGLATVFFLGLRRGEGSGFWTGWQVLYRVLFPGIVLGIGVYVFVTKSVFGGRFYTDETVLDVIFLPVATPEAAPLDRYNLFSLAHLGDYINLWFLWSAPGLLLLLGGSWRANLKVWDPALLMVGAGFGVYFLFFFVLNPLLGMHNDWDLMSLPVPLFLGVVVLVAGQMEVQGRLLPLSGSLLAFCLLGLSTFIVNADQAALSQRMEVVGSRNFRTSYIGSITSWKCALNAEPEVEREIGRLQRILAGNAPYVTWGNDPEYAYLHWRLGTVYEKKQQNLNAAVAQYLKARDAAPFFGINLNHLVGALFYLGDYARADEYAEDMIRYPYPDRPTALRAGVQVALEAQNWPRALARTRAYLEIAPGDALFQEIGRRLETGESRETIRELAR